MSEAGRYRVAERDLQGRIKQILLDRSLRSGDPLPTEAELIELLGVSRGSLREAFKGLQAVGIIETRHGSGSFIARPTLTPMATGLAFHSLLGEPSSNVSMAADLADIREILETALIRRVAIDPSPSLISDLRALVASMLSIVDSGHHPAEFDDADLDFHARLYADLGNTLVPQLLEAFWRALRPVRHLLPAPFDQPADAALKHHAIVEALAEKDPEAAERAMRDHFGRTREWIADGAKRTG